MPYIPIAERMKLRNKYVTPRTAGELNFAITDMVVRYLERDDEIGFESYDTYNEVIGVLECAKQELYRRKIAPYEDKKIGQNGDVY